MDNLNSISSIMMDSIVQAWNIQGHGLTGNFIGSLREEFLTEGDRVIINIWGLEYGIYKSVGIPANKIPYGRGGRGGGSSKYITGLQEYVQARMGISDPRESLSIAFAIAETHSVNGMPGSGFLEDAISASREKIGEAVKLGLRSIIKKNL
jgi:hypothetical protein